MDRPELSLGVILAFIVGSECVVFSDSLSFFVALCVASFFFVEANQHANEASDWVQGTLYTPPKDCVSMSL